MSPADAAPSEEVAKTGQGEEPVKELITDARSLIDECQERKTELESHRGERTALAVNVGEDLGSHALGSKSLERASGTESARVGDGQDSNGNHSVEDGWQTLDAGVLDGYDEWRSLGVGARRAKQEIRVRWHDETDHEQVHDWSASQQAKPSDYPEAENIP